MLSRHDHRATDQSLIPQQLRNLFELRRVTNAWLDEAHHAFLTTDPGPRAENLPLVVVTRWIGDHRVRLPIPTDARMHVRIVRDLLARSGLRPVVDRTYTLDCIVDAYRYVETEQKLGTVVVTVA